MAIENPLRTKAEKSRIEIYKNCEHFNSYTSAEANNSFLMKKYNRARFDIEQDIFDNKLEIDRVEDIKISMNNLFNSRMIPYLIFSVVLAPFTALLTFLFMLASYLFHKSVHKNFIKALESYKGSVKKSF